MAESVTRARPASDRKSAAKGPAVKRARYEADLYTWVEEQVALLRAGRFDEIDVENIAEELSSVGRSEYDKLWSSLRVLVMHMLKWDQQPEHRTPSWIYSIREQRLRIARVLKDNPGLKPHKNQALKDAYPMARNWASDETHLHPSEFPRECPYTWDDLLDRPFDFDSVKK